MERLAGELRELERELRVDLPREIRTAIAMGDLRENAEYHAALERQAFVKARIGQLRERLSSLASIDLSRLPRGQAALGSKLTLRDLDNDQELRYELVLPELADLDRGWVSIGSPIGRGLIGRKTGDVVEIQIPSGRRRLEILELRTVHDGA
jgi:transcription elongation factor GreA